MTVIMALRQCSTLVDHYTYSISLLSRDRVLYSAIDHASIDHDHKGYLRRIVFE